MKKYSRVLAAHLVSLVLCALLGSALSHTTYAKARGKSARAKASSKQSAKRGGKAVARASRGKKGRARAAAPVQKFNTKEMQALLRKRGKLSKEERGKIASYRRARAEAERRRRRAIIEARLRAIRARDEALRNIASTHVLNDNITGEDPEVRRAALEALGGRAGTVVVMDPNNGRIFSIVNQQMALGSPVKPCSTVKLIVGLGALHENVFDPNTDVQITARYAMNLTDATARSDNPFFQVLGRLLGYERVMDYARNFGFGEVTGVNYPGESPGFLPEEATREMPSHGDGFGVTAMQLAAFTAAIANGGNLYTPRVPRTAEDAANFRPLLKRKINMSPEDRLRLMAGMTGAVNFGTAKLAYDTLSQVAGKTGTCTGATDKLGLFTSFSSQEDPRLVVSVITTGSTEAGKRAADIAGRVYRAISFRVFRQPQMTPAPAISEFPRLGNTTPNPER